MILGVILCCVICVQIEARVIIQVHKGRQEQEMNINRIREQRDVYGAETVQLNGRSPRAPSWPEANSNKEKMFLLPKILEVGDEINITMLIPRNPQWFSVNLICVQEGPNGTEPDHNNIASQVNFNFDTDNEKGSIVMKMIMNGIEESNTVDLNPADLIPDMMSNTTSEVLIKLNVIVNNDGLNEVYFYISESFLHKFKLKHDFNVIRYITINGDVTKVKRLDFLFA